MIKSRQAIGRNDNRQMTYIYGYAVTPAKNEAGKARAETNSLQLIFLIL